MTKLGDEYQALVGAVMQALDPGACVSVGVWIVGPDGRRDLDVEVRGCLDGADRFVLVECKDWRNPVGIGVVDALDSKRRDLQADEAVIYSNSGFTEPALRKASRLGIGLASALRAGDRRVHGQVQKELVAKALSLERLSATLFPCPGADAEFPDSWLLPQLTFDDKPVQNWIALLSVRLLREHEPDGKWQFTCTFQNSPAWAYAGKPVSVGALRLHMDCRRSWVAQIVREDVTLGLYDHLRKRVSIPNRQGYILGPIDQEAWKPYVAEPKEVALDHGSFALKLTLLNPLCPSDDSTPPDLDQEVLEQEFKCIAP